jgi:hypothetical protein
VKLLEIQSSPRGESSDSIIHAVTLRSLSENEDLRDCIFIPLQSSPSLAKLIDDPVFR